MALCPCAYEVHGYHFLQDHKDVHSFLTSPLRDIKAGKHKKMKEEMDAMFIDTEMR